MKSSSCEIGKYEAYLMSDFEKYLLGCVASIAKERSWGLIRIIKCQITSKDETFTIFSIKGYQDKAFKRH